MFTIELPKELEARAQALHREAFVYDACMFGTGLIADPTYEIQCLNEGGVNAANVTFCSHKQNFLRGVDRFFDHLKMVDRNSDKLRFCTTVAELEQCKKEGRIGIVAHFQDAKPIEDSIDYLKTFHKLGLRVLQLAYQAQGYLGAGCCEKGDAGLTYFGQEVVEECNRLGILIDLSHVNHQTSWDAIKHSKAPVAFTHVGIYKLCPAYGRNKPDDLLKAVVDTGGVVGMVWFPPFIKKNPETHEVLPSTVDDVLDQMEYAIKLLGVDSVGIGTDLCDYISRTLVVPWDSGLPGWRARRPDVCGSGRSDRFDPFPVGFESHAGMLNITRGLIKRGYKDEDIKKVLGGNWLRLLRDIWGQ